MSQSIENAEAAGAQYARDQFNGDHFRDWVWQQMIEADLMRSADPSSVTDDSNEIARKMLEQLRWDIHRDMGAKEILPLIEPGDEDVPERELVRAFFHGLDTELLRDQNNRDWLVDLITEIDEELRGKKMSEARTNKSTRKAVYIVEPGRQIYCDGKPFISIGRQGDTMPAVADEVTHVIADLLNQSGWIGGSRSQRGPGD